VPTSSGSLTAATPIEITWNNGEGLTFRRKISLDDKFMFTITQSVENNSATAVELFPYGRISRHGEPETTGFYILHEGFLGVFNNTLEEANYDDVRDDGSIDFETQSGWLGFTDKYWLTALIPDQSLNVRATYSDTITSRSDRFRTQYIYAEGNTIAPGGRSEVTNHFFAGAKENAVLVDYGTELNIPRFDFAIDWGLFRFFTRPLFRLLDFFGKTFGNFGIAILLTTVIVKLAFFPLANKQYRSMGQMKKIQPEMVALRERYADDKVKQQQELMALYKREQVNPMAGCLPILLQIPVFFAIYKVLFVTIEMRQAPFFGWIQDLAAPDPTTMFNLFGLLPWDPSGIPVIGTTLALGVWPLIMGLSMFIQMRMNPAPQDPIQEKMFLFMPIIFTFLLARFPAGLVIYWAWNNTLSILQQYVIMRRSGVEVELGKNIGLDKLMARFSKKSSAGDVIEAKDDTKDA
jgi:YidC/Oxa1 family membrane protein insertase